MDDVVWWVINNLFTFSLWLLIEEEGRKVAVVLWFLAIFLSIFILIKSGASDDKD